MSITKLISANNNNNNKNIKRNRLSAEARRQQLVDIAISVTAQKGLGQARHSGIAKLANVAVSTVFFYFPTVNDLNEAIIDELEKSIERVSLDILLDKYDTSAPLSILYKQFDLISCVKKTTSNVDEQIIIFLQWSSSPNYSMWPRFQKFRERNQNIIKIIIRKAIKDNYYNETIDINTATIMFSAIHRLVFTMYFTGVGEQPIKEIITSAHNHLFNKNH